MLWQPCLINIEDSAEAGGFVNPALYPAQEASSETKGYQTQGQAKTHLAAAGPGSFREDSYNTDYKRAFTFSHNENEEGWCTGRKDGKVGIYLSEYVDNGEPGVKVRALLDYQAVVSNQLDLKEGTTKLLKFTCFTAQPLTNLATVESKIILEQILMGNTCLYYAT